MLKWIPCNQNINTMECNCNIQYKVRYILQYLITNTYSYITITYLTNQPIVRITEVYIRNEILGILTFIQEPKYIISFIFLYSKNSVCYANNHVIFQILINSYICYITSFDIVWSYAFIVEQHDVSRIWMEMNWLICLIHLSRW